MHNQLRSLAAAVLAALFLFSGAMALPVRADDKKQALTQQQNQAQQEYESAQNELEQIQNQQQETESQINQLQGQAAEIATQLQSVYNALQEAERQMLEYQAQADAAAQALAQKQEEYDTNLTRSKEQLRAMQMLDGGGAIGLLAQAQSLYQLLTFSEVLQQISSKNNECLLSAE